MSITTDQKTFIKKVSAGIRVYMATYHMADEIWANPEDEVEEDIKNNILFRQKSAIGVERAWFSEKKFCDAIDTFPDEKIKKLLYYLDKRDMPLCDVYVESCLHPSDLSEIETKWGELLINGEMITFEDFLS
jgi:hypothetical protein